MGKGKQRSSVLDLQTPISTTDVLSKPYFEEEGPTSLYNAQSNEPLPQDEEQLLEATPLFTLITTYLSYFILIVFGHIQDFFGALFYPHDFKHLKTQNGYAPVNSGFDTFYHRRLYVRIRDCFNRPTTDVPGRTLKCLERVSDDYNKTFK